MSQISLKYFNEIVHVYILVILPTCEISAWNLPVPNIQYETPDDGHRRCPKHIEFYDRINLDN
jgi:hypothetical protein